MIHYDKKGNKLSFESSDIEKVTPSITDETYLQMRLNDTFDAGIEKAPTTAEVMTSSITAIKNLWQTKCARIASKKGYGSKSEVYKYINSRGVSANGRLFVKGTELVNKNGEKFQLKGMSTFTQALGTTAYMHEGIETTKIYGANVVRACNYTVSSPWGTGYAGYTDGGDVEWHKKIIKRIIRDAIDLDMYVIVDWHCIRATEYDLALYQDQAIDFFVEIASEFPDCPNVIYELCNEPRVTWSAIKEYASNCIPAIRAYSPNAVILVGTPTNSAELSYPASDPLDYENIMYVWHYYAGTFNFIGDRGISDYLGVIPVFVTEWGMTDASGDGVIYEQNSTEFVKFCEKNNISWCYWALYFRDNSGYILPKSEAGKSYGGWTTDILTPAGQFIVEQFDDVGMFSQESE